MNRDIKRLGIVSLFCFLPTALIGYALLKKNESVALHFFRASLYIFLSFVIVAGSVVVIKGGAIIKVLVSIY